MVGVNPEEALQSTNRKFIRRFEAMESAVRASGVAHVVDALAGPVRVLVTVRPMDRLLSSAWQQSVRNGRDTGLETFLQATSYVLDEPSVGLHPCDTERLIASLRELQQRGNTVVVVEHDEEVMWAADLLVDIGPGPGKLGGAVIAFGSPDQFCNNSSSLTSPSTCRRYDGLLRTMSLIPTLGERIPLCRPPRMS